MANYFRVALLLVLAAPVLAADAPRYSQAGGSTLEFEFTQLGAPASGHFGKFTTELAYDEKNLAAGSLKVTIQVASLDTGDSERDGVLKDVDLFDAQKHPTATFVANSLTRSSGGGLEAVGKLTIRGVTRDARVPLHLKPTAAGLELTGETMLRRLDFGVGQGEWKSTESVGDEVRVRYKVMLVKAR